MMANLVVLGLVGALVAALALKPVLRRHREAKAFAESAGKWSFRGPLNAEHDPCGDTSTDGGRA